MFIPQSPAPFWHSLLLFTFTCWVHVRQETGANYTTPTPFLNHTNYTLFFLPHGKVYTTSKWDCYVMSYNYIYDITNEVLISWQPKTCPTPSVLVLWKSLTLVLAKKSLPTTTVQGLGVCLVVYCPHFPLQQLFSPETVCWDWEQSTVFTMIATDHAIITL